MKYADVAGLAVSELRKRQSELRAQLFQSKMKNALGQLANPMTIRALRRDVARIQTVLAQKSERGQS
jgi:large subunit ribosomal protein L29